MTKDSDIPSAFELTESAHGASLFVMKKNGLKVLVMPKKELPVVGTMITYHVGSRHELPGHTGATHILEHVMFKGSKKYDPKKGNGTWQLLEKKGSQGNATTWCDRTNYYWVSPLSLMQDALLIEADRMRNLLLRSEDLESEMTVVRNEYESGENDPHHRLGKYAWYEAFTLHPYRIPTIGTKEDIEAVTVEKLRTFYDTFYWPNNATLSIIGDTDIPSALKEVQKAFGDIPHHEIVEPDFLHEPPQEGLRRFELKRKGTVNAVTVCFKAPAGLSPDTHAVSALTAILGAGKSSVLYQELVDTGLAVDVDIEYPRFKDPSLIEIYVPLAEGASHEKVESVILEQVKKISEKGIKKETLERAKAYIGAEYSFAMSSVSGTLSAVNESIARGDWKDAFTFVERLEHVTPAGATKILQKYFSEQNLTIGRLYAV